MKFYKKTKNIVKKDPFTQFAKKSKEYGTNALANAVLELEKFGQSVKVNKLTQDVIVRAIETKDMETLTFLSNYFYEVSGVYKRLVNYFAGMLPFDWVTYPHFLLTENADKMKVLEQQAKILDFFDNLNIQTTFTDINMEILLNGVFYGYFKTSSDNSFTSIQKLPANYCRSRMSFNNQPIVEFNVKYFTTYRDATTRLQVLTAMPKELQTGYDQYLKGNIEQDINDRGYWVVLDPDYSMYYTFSNSHIPFFVATIPAILDLEKAKQLDMTKTMQQLLKIIVQKLPLDKNNELIFDTDESRELHENAVNMIRTAVNVDLLTTFAEVEVLDLDNASKASSSSDALARVERGIFNEAGVSQMLFATDGNLALASSIKNDESLMFFLKNQYQNRLNDLLVFLFKNEKGKFLIELLDTTIYNRDDQRSAFESLGKSGYCKILPPIAAGISQTMAISLIKYENDILELQNNLIPLSISSTQSSNDSTDDDSSTANEKLDEELTEKTIQNKESMS